MKLPIGPIGPRAPSFDAAAIHATIRRALASAGLDGVDLAPPGRPAFDARPPPGRGRLDTRTFANHAGSRDYQVYVPPAAAPANRPMVVMLHGCTQSASDFAAGTQMNRLADEHGFIVVYPEQAAHANPSRCWNWFKPEDQRRDAGEPSLIAGMVRAVAQAEGADPGRIFVAGLSAGAAMAVVLGETYPELFAGVGAHSGLPYGSAHDIPSALAAMKGRSGGVPGPHRAAGPAVPVIVFHGDRDHTVQASNGAHIERQSREAHARHASGAPLHASTQSGLAPGGRRFTRTIHSDPAGRPRIEHWTVHGAGHAWSGGHAGGSFTDGSGPDASAEMVRFFLALAPAGDGDLPTPLR